jgi:integral membrane protein
MQTYSKTTFEVVATIEGVSLLVLLGVAMPLKYLGGMPMATQVVGLLHGLAFIAYAVVVIDALATRHWSKRTATLGLIAAFLPAGTFAFVGHVRRLAGETRTPRRVSTDAEEVPRY